MADLVCGASAGDAAFVAREWLVGISAHLNCLGGDVVSKVDADEFCIVDGGLGVEDSTVYARAGHELGQCIATSGGVSVLEILGVGLSVLIVIEVMWACFRVVRRMIRAAVQG